ncbi:general stress protein [Arthrobacter wenxiniae]|uniref:ECF transporter S component n=1 Tax=Arthrobacter wenxiniae TaxID=2713570 RepID=A0A7Y7M036_9MICC|nr:general stress protein [Arthrobacter wenxiniae]NVM95336.1 ECF transporter S component [Arthrobacter wenxiniae]
MANLFGRTRPMDEARVVPTGETIGSYTSYLDAQKAVDYLADEKFPVQHVSIVGNDLKMVERVTGKLSYPRVALSGAMTGAWFGLFIGVMLSFFDSNAGAGGGPYLNVMTAVLMGAAFWMLFAIIGYAAQRGKRDFTSTNQVLASNYDVIVTPDVAMDARRLLAQLPMNSAAPGPYQGQGQNQAHQGYRPPAQPPVSGQQPPASGQAGQQPPRPEGWHDPYGAPQQQPVPDVPQTEESHERPGQAPLSGPRRGQFPDLPDGRPQYGVRVDNPPQQAPAPEQADGDVREP